MGFSLRLRRADPPLTNERVAHVARSRGGADARSVPAEVIVVEPTGAETELLVRVGAAEIVVVVHGRTRAEPGEPIHLSVDTGAVHLFDPTSGIALTA